MAPAEPHLGILSFSLWITPVIHCRQPYDALGWRGEACLSAAQIGFGFFFPPSPLVFAAYLGCFLKKYSIQNIKGTNYPCAVYLKADKLMATTLQLI